jgi:ferric-dicitrate binding protein FerR (iron transport regulator)
MDHIPEPLIVRFISGEATSEEIEKLFEWVEKDERHHRILMERLEAWHANHSYPHEFNLSRGLNLLNEQIGARVQPLARKYVWWRAAAALLFIVTSSLLVYQLTVKSSAEAELTKYHAPADKQLSITLGDGTRITLNGGATVWSPKEFSGESRKVKVTGEVYFEVARNPQKPFVIITDQVETRVLGTSFNMKSDAAGVVVTVVEGKVQVSYRNTTEVLTARQKATCDFRMSTLRVDTADLSHELAWKYGVLKFNDHTLGQVVFTLEKQYGVSIRFSHESQKKCLFSGSISNQSVDKILAAICFTTGLELKKAGEGYVFTGKGCE